MEKKEFFFPLMKGSELTPARFWSRRAAHSKEQLRSLKKDGYVTDRSKNAITREDLRENQSNATRLVDDKTG